MQRQLTTNAVGRLVGVSERTVANWIDRNYLPAFRTPGGHRRVDPRSLAEFLQKRGMPVPPSLIERVSILIVEDDLQVGETMRNWLVQADEGFDTDMAALTLHVGRRHEGGADQQKYRRLVLPVIGAVEHRAAEHAVAQDRAGGDQGNGSQEDNGIVAKRERLTDSRHEPIARGDAGQVFLIRKRTMHHAATSVASFSNVAEVAVLAL